VSSRNALIHAEGLQRLSKAYFQDRERNPDALLGAFQKLRLSDAWAKVDATVQVANGILQTEPAVVVFTSFQDIASMIVKKLHESGWSAELLTGKSPVAKRSIAVDSFQNGLSSAFVATFGAGGVGLTLTAASTVVLLDRPWTPGEAFQAEDRVRRIGQTKPVKSIWISAFELDEQIDQLIQSKKQTADAVLAGDESSTGGMQKVSILKLLEKVLPQTA
jgi:SNF2 family DNA or RNA helicase